MAELVTAYTVDVRAVLAALGTRDSLDDLPVSQPYSSCTLWPRSTTPPSSRLIVATRVTLLPAARLEPSPPVLLRQRLAYRVLFHVCLVNRHYWIGSGDTRSLPDLQDNPPQLPIGSPPVYPPAPASHRCCPVASSHGHSPAVTVSRSPTSSASLSPRVSAPLGESMCSCPQTWSCRVCPSQMRCACVSCVCRG